MKLRYKANQAWAISWAAGLPDGKTAIGVGIVYCNGEKRAIEMGYTHAGEQHPDVPRKYIMVAASMVRLDMFNDYVEVSQ
jgi:hypothetical protein